LSVVQDGDGHGTWLQKLNTFKQQHGADIAWSVDSPSGGMWTAELSIDRKTVSHSHGHSSKRQAREAAARLFLQRKGIS
jgi:hypothetical protein